MTRFRIVALACILVVPATAIGDDLIRFAFSAEAQRCCASTGGQCAQLSTPDDCCRTPQQVASQGYTSFSPDSRVDLKPQMHAALMPSFEVARGVALARHRRDANKLKRPHDPPHLHSFPLLI